MVKVEDGSIQRIIVPQGQRVEIIADPPTPMSLSESERRKKARADALTNVLEYYTTHSSAVADLLGDFENKDRLRMDTAPTLVKVLDHIERAGLTKREIAERTRDFMMKQPNSPDTETAGLISRRYATFLEEMGQVKSEGGLEQPTASSTG